MSAAFQEEEALGKAYDAQAAKLAKGFRENDKQFEMPEAVRGAGPKV